MRLPVDKFSNSFDRSRAEHLSMISGARTGGASATDNLYVTFQRNINSLLRAQLVGVVLCSFNT